MALVTTKRNVDVLPGQAAPTVFHCSQHDVGAAIILGLVNAGGNFSIPSGVTAIIQGSCSNGAVFTPVTATVSGSDITFNLSAEMTSIAGPTVCEAVLSKDTDVLGTANFVLDVEPSAMGSDTPPVFADAAWLWMVDKMGTETVSALGDKTVIDAINGKADQSDVTALSDAKLDKNQGTANAGKYLKVGANGDVETADLDVTTDKTLSVADKAADAKAVGDEITDLKADLRHIQQHGAPVSASVKAALLQLASKVAYIDDSGNDYYQDLYDALNPPAKIDSISAVYTQSGAVYLDTDIDSLTSDLVVTVLYTNQTTEVIPATDYTLSGTLAIGTSTITVAYRGYTATFSVTVTYPQHALENGTHNFGSSQYNRVLTVTNGNHIKYETDDSQAGAYINLSFVSENANSTTTANINRGTRWFLIPGGSSVEFTVKNIILENETAGSWKWNVALRDASNATTDIKTGDKTTNADVTVNITTISDLDISLLFAYLHGHITLFEADVELTVDGERWI